MFWGIRYSTAETLVWCGPGAYFKHFDNPSSSIERPSFWKYFVFNCFRLSFHHMINGPELQPWQNCPGGEGGNTKQNLDFRGFHDGQKTFQHPNGPTGLPNLWSNYFWNLPATVRITLFSRCRFLGWLFLGFRERPNWNVPPCESWHSVLMLDRWFGGHFM